MGVLDTLAGATQGRKSVTLILNAALEAQWEDLSRQLDDAAASDYDSGSLAMPATTQIVNQMEEIRERVEASQATFHFEPMDWTKRPALQAEHLPRKDNLADRVSGYNVSTFVPALIRATCVSIVDAAGDEATEIPDATWVHLLGDPAADPPVKPALTYGQVTRLFAAAKGTDDGATRVPPSARSLLGSQDSGASLAQPSPGTSPRSGSEGGSRSGSRKSSATKKARSSSS